MPSTSSETNLVDYSRVVRSCSQKIDQFSQHLRKKLSVSQDGKKGKVVQWMMATSLLVSACLAQSFATPFLTYEPEMVGKSNDGNLIFAGFEPLTVTLWHSFDPEAITGHGDEKHGENDDNDHEADHHHGPNLMHHDHDHRRRRRDDHVHEGDDHVHEGDDHDDEDHGDKDHGDNDHDDKDHDDDDHDHNHDIDQDVKKLSDGEPDALKGDNDEQDKHETQIDDHDDDDNDKKDHHHDHHEENNNMDHDNVTKASKKARRKHNHDHDVVHGHTHSHDHGHGSHHHAHGGGHAHGPGHYHFHEEPFCCMMWLKMVFMAGFAISQFIFGFLADHYDRWMMLRLNIKVLIISGMISAAAGNVYIFSFAWFFVALTSSAVYLLVITHLVEVADYQVQEWKFRLVSALCFQLSWSLSRFIALAIVYFCNEWSSVLILLTVVIATTYLFLEQLIWSEEIQRGDEERLDHGEPPIWQAIRGCPTLYANLISLGLSWFVLGVTFYGFLHSWCKISSTHKKFENDILSAVLGAIGEIMALLTCCTVKRKNLPYSVFLLCSAVAYFLFMVSTDEKSDHSNLTYSPNATNGTVSSSFYGKTLYVAHINSFISAAAFAILWIITVEQFPKRYRSSLLGICSGLSRIGGIVGILLGELQFLHLNTTVIIIMGVTTLVSALLFQVLPDFTRLNRLPSSLADYEEKSRRRPTQNQDNENLP